MVLKECLTDFKELYEKSNKLVNEESKTDPPTEPYRSHYAARDVLEQLKTALEKKLKEQNNEEDKQTLNIILAFVYRDLGRIHVFTEEVTTGEELLQKCLEMVMSYKDLPAGIIPYVGVLNELGLICANREEYQKAHDYLKKAEEAYLDFKSIGQNALAITDIFGLPEEVEVDEGSKELESLYTLCAYYLAQVFNHLNELDLSAQYCHMTMKRQLVAKSYEPIDFALNAATLSQYFIGANMFKEARHHLAAATLIMAEHETSMIKPEMSEEQAADVTETFRHRYADVARCWAKYGICLLISSKKRLYNDDEETLAEDVARMTVKKMDYVFPELQLSVYENRVPCEFCLTFDDAKIVYHFVISWLDQAKEYYKPETDATEYAKIIKDYAELYEYIVFFEENPSNQIKMHKRRAKYFEDLLELLNPVFYLSICRESWYGAGLAHSSILHIRMDALKGNRAPTATEVQKVNQTCQRAIKHFEDFLNTYLEKDGITIKPINDEDELHVALYACFYMGSLYYKLIDENLEIKLEYMKKSHFFYKKFIDECESREKACERLKAEMGVCREMANLLPLKIQSIKDRLKK